MQIDKSQILELLRSQGDNDKAAAADSDLPDQVDTDQHADVLAKHGIDISQIMGLLGGGAGGAGGLAGGLGKMLGG